MQEILGQANVIDLLRRLHPSSCRRAFPPHHATTVCSPTPPPAFLILCSTPPDPGVTLRQLIEDRLPLITPKHDVIERPTECTLSFRTIRVQPYFANYKIVIGFAWTLMGLNNNRATSLMCPKDFPSCEIVACFRTFDSIKHISEQ
jgi:hypothetical protein